jgi:hypothetical protein
MNFKAMIFSIVVGLAFLGAHFDALAGKGDIVINAIKKGASKIDDLASSGKGVAHPSGDIHPPHTLPNKTIVSPVDVDSVAFLQSTAGIQISKRLSLCISNKLEANPKLSNQEAREYCQKSFLYCKSSKNNYGFTDDQCIADVNERPNPGKSFRPSTKFENLPKFDSNSLRIPSN